MFPFIFAFILAIGIPFLPYGLHRVLPALRFNFLSTSYAPQRSFVPSSESPLVLEHGYSRDSGESGGSSQFLIFPSPNFPDYEADSDMLAYMSFTEKLELNYPQTSIWLVICAQLLYQLLEAMVIMTLSFLFAATFLSRRSLSTLMERFCTALFICWHFTPKAALSSFFPDVLLCVHKYWMDNSVSSDQVPTTPTDISQHDSLGVLADRTPGTAPISEALDLIASKEANCWSENSSSLALITPPRSRETLALPELALIPLGQPAYSLSTSKQDTQVKPLLLLTYGPSVNVGSHHLGSTTKLSQDERSSDVIRTPSERRVTSPSIVTSQNSNSTGVGTSDSKADLSGTDVMAASLGHNPTQDPYSASKHTSTTTSTSVPPGENSDNKSSDAISGSSLVHDSTPNINSSPSKPEPDERHAEDLRPSLSEKSYSIRRRYKSDGIQVRSSRCHLGYPAASPDPAKVDGTCVFWKSPVRHDERGGGVPEKQVLAPGFPSRSSSFKRISGSRLDQAVGAGSVGSPDSAHAGVVLTPEGTIMVPASQRSDGSMRKEIKVRPGHFLREPFAEKYRPPAARVRTSTWDPRSCELLTTPPSSPYASNSSLPFTPMSVHQRFFGRQYDSPAPLARDWRRLGSTPVAKENNPSTPPVAKIPAPEFLTRSETTTIASPIPTRPFDNQSSLIQSGDQILSRPSELAHVEKAMVPTPDDDTEQPESSKCKPVRAAAEALDNEEKENRVPLRDITPSLIASEALGRLKPHSTPTVLSSMTARMIESLQVTNVVHRDLETPSRTETLLPSPHRKRKPSGEPPSHHQSTVKSVAATMCSPLSESSPTPSPFRRPRTRRSAPHLAGNNTKRQVLKTQTPEGSAKRRRMRTASALGTENIAVAFAATAATVDRNGQIFLPAGTGWKGRSLNSLTPSQLPVAQQRQKQPTLASAAATLA